MLCAKKFLVKFALTSAGAVSAAEAGLHLGSAEVSWSPACKCSWQSPLATAWSTETSSAGRPQPAEKRGEKKKRRKGLWVVTSLDSASQCSSLGTPVSPDYTSSAWGRDARQQLAHWCRSKDASDGPPSLNDWLTLSRPAPRDRAGVERHDLKCDRLIKVARDESITTRSYLWMLHASLSVNLEDARCTPRITTPNMNDSRADVCDGVSVFSKRPKRLCLNIHEQYLNWGWIDLTLVFSKLCQSQRNAALQKEGWREKAKWGEPFLFLSHDVSSSNSFVVLDRATDWGWWTGVQTLTGSVLELVGNWLWATLTNNLKDSGPKQVGAGRRQFHKSSSFTCVIHVSVSWKTWIVLNGVTWVFWPAKLKLFSNKHW